MSYFNQIQLTNQQINEILEYIEQYEIQEHQMIKKTQRILNEN